MNRHSRRQPAALLFTERAISDLRGIEHYSVAEWGARAAAKYFDEVTAAIDRISENPDLLAREPAFAKGLYFYRIRKHVLVCDYRDQTIVVLAVVHTAMDLRARLVELEPRLSAEVKMLREKLHRRS